MGTPQRIRRMYLIYTKFNIVGTFVLCDEAGHAIVSPYYFELPPILIAQADKEGFIIETIIFVEFLMEEEITS